MSVVRSILLFAVAAVAEIGGAWMVWQGVRENRGLAWIRGRHRCAGRLWVRRHVPGRPQLRAHPRRLWRDLRGRFPGLGGLDGFRPDRYDIAGAVICLTGVAVIMYAPRPA
jgi:small multidrug resistance family-3 protein